MLVSCYGARGGGGGGREEGFLCVYPYKLMPVFYVGLN